MIKHFHRFRLDDGILVNKLADIKYFETEKDYLKGLQLMSENQKTMMNASYDFPIDAKDIEDFTTIFESFIGNKEDLIGFELNDNESNYDFVEWYDESNFSMMSIDSAGAVIGKTIYRFEDLKCYWLDNRECRRRKLLYVARKNGAL